MSKATALIVDDEPDIRELLEITLGRMGLDTDSAATLKAAHEALEQREFDLCLTDMRLPDGNGLDLVDFIQASHPRLPVAVITAHGNMDAAVRALKSGAFDFVSKPIDLGQLREMVNSALQLPDESSQNTGTTTQGQSPRLLGHSEPMQQLQSDIAKLARSQAPVFIHGESGTGKELVARAIHSLSARSSAPFVPVNCSAIPGELLESEFFGHTKGSFSGATSDNPGLFRAAHGGTLFLDEVADLPLTMQVKLLRAIQEKAVRPVGANSEEKVDVRILSASHKDLESLVASGDFRQDLFYRINVIRLDVPALRERREDIPELADYILDKLVRRDGGRSLSLSKGAAEALCHYRFPGNVRELENILERAAALCEGTTLSTKDLDLPEASQPATALPGNTGLTEQLEQSERQQIEQALEQTRWNRTEAAKLLGLSFRQLRYRIKKLGID
ncbi:MAG: sigma-54-dependent transcriptional regulator [Pseudomonadota bacterium]